MPSNWIRPNRKLRVPPPGYRGKYHRYRRTQRPRYPRLISVGGLILVVLAFLCTLAFRFVYLPAGTGAERTVVIPQGSGTQEIAHLLQQENLIRSAFGFRVLARLNRADAHLRAGEYRLSPTMRPENIIRKLTKGEVITYPVTVPEGYTAERIAMLMEEKGLFTRQAFDEAMARVYETTAPTAYGFPLPPKNTAYKHALEGYLFPETYQFFKGMKPDEMVKAMLANLDRALDAKLKARAAEKKISLHDLLTMASIVEKEAQKPEERPIIAAVYLNRLKIGMKLDADPTVKYALVEPGKLVTLEDLEVDSPYNTYKNAGLPPGPIANPGRPAMEAVLSPAGVDYLYFVAKGDGTHAFAATWDEHVRNIARYSQP